MRCIYSELQHNIYSFRILIIIYAAFGKNISYLRINASLTCPILVAQIQNFVAREGFIQ